MACTCFFGGCAHRCSPRRMACKSFFCGCARRCLTRRIVCTCFFGGCARRCSTRRIACTGFLCGCARRCSTRRIACTRFFGGCARRCLVHCISCTVSRFGDARTCLIPRIANIGFFGGCAGTLRACSSPLRRLRYYRPLRLHAAALGPRCLPRMRDAFSSPQPPLYLCLGSYPACAWPLSFSCFQASRPPPHLPLRADPVLSPRPQHRTHRETDVFHPLSRFRARRCPQAV
jgi:hypothetical protein